MRTRSVVAVLAVACMVIAWSGGAVGARRQGMIVSGALAQFYGYLTPAMVVEKGGDLTYSNFDIVLHDVVHDVKADGVSNKKKDKWCKNFAKGACPLFWSPQAGLNQRVPVSGLSNLTPGEIYTFYCTLHPGMKGRLIVAA